MKSERESCSVVSDSLWPHGLYSPWISQGQNTGVGSLSLIQGIFPTQGSNLDLLHSRWILHQLSHKGSPRILGWVTYPFSSRSSQPRNWTGVSCIAGRFFTNWAIREAKSLIPLPKRFSQRGANNLIKTQVVYSGDSAKLKSFLLVLGASERHPLLDVRLENWNYSNHFAASWDILSLQGVLCVTGKAD